MWEVKTRKPGKVPRDDVNQLLGQIEVESKRAANTRMLGCLLTPSGEAADDAGEAARTKIEALLPPDRWLDQLLSPSQGQIIGADDIAELFPQR